MDFWIASALDIFGEVPLVEDGTIKSDGSTYANLALGWLMDNWQVQLDILNIFDSSR